MQQEIVISIAIAMFGCFVTNEIERDFFGDRRSGYLTRILSYAVYTFMLADVMTLKISGIVFPFASFLGFMVLSFNYKIEKRSRISVGTSILVLSVIIYAVVYMLMRYDDTLYQVYIIFIAMEYISIKAYIKIKEMSLSAFSSMFIAIPLLYVVIVVYVINNAVMSGIYRGMMLFAVIVVNILMMAFYNEFVKQKQRSMQQEIALEHKLSVEKQVKTMSEASESLSRVRHDMKNHMLVMSDLLKQQEYEKLNNYIEKLVDKVSVADKIINTGNIELDAIINSKISEARVRDIELRSLVSVPPDVNVSGYDLSVIVGNILDNAIRGADGVDNGERFIDFEINFDRERLYISAVNPYKGIILFGENGLPLTTKSDKGEHGIGISNVKRTVDKYGGEFNIRTKNNCFCVEIYIY